MLEKSPNPEPSDLSASNRSAGSIVFAAFFLFVLLTQFVILLSDCSANGAAERTCTKRCYPLQIKVCDRHLVQCADDHIYLHQSTAEKR